jgi:hypothetical protein
MIVPSGKWYIPTCDGCGKELEPEYGWLESIHAMKIANWDVVRPKKMSPEWYHFCPACKERGKSIG